MKSIFMKSVLVSLGSWFIFVSIDSMFLAVFTLTQSFNHDIFPDLFSFVEILACYLCIGIMLGLISFIILSIKNKNFQLKKLDGFYLPLALSLTASCMINIYIISSELRLPFQHLITYAFIFGLLLWGFMKIINYLRKGMMVSLLSLCISLEMFWSITRGLLRGGILFIIVSNLNIIYIFLLALFICFAVFMLLYCLVPNLFLKIKGLTLKLSLITIIICLFFNDTPNAHADSERIDLSISKPNIILIVMDTTRVDHLSCYGYHKKNNSPY